MFTGLIEGVGTILGVRHSHPDTKLTLLPPFDASTCQIGESIAVNGVCLTVTEIAGNSLSMDVSRETLSRSTLQYLKGGEQANVERALRLTDRLGGHLVSGHVDGIGTIVQKNRSGRSWVLRIALERALFRYIIEKGSIAVDGISLTINACENDFFEVNIIPQTGQETTLLEKGTGSRVNIETDLIGKYVEKLLFRGTASAQGQSGGSGIQLETLIQQGFVR